ncbi:MAG: 1-acyl-sn-glycerol-3-phosphate acyltransferase [Saprospiraceae bacterium]|nr:1-acyl-sn-glycerol-3-phosphate acyltransferase [Saprospiraceae bacterium]
MAENKIEFKGPFPSIIENLTDWPISRFYRDRKKIVEELGELSYKSILEKYGDNLPDVLKQTIHSETIRSKNIPWQVDPPDELDYWKELGSEFKRIALTEEGQQAKYQDLCKKIIRRYAEEIPGDFVPKTFLFARKFLTRMFGAIYNPWYKKDQNGMWWGKRDEVLNKFKVTGPVEKIRSLFDRTSVVVVPTHFSNLDSPLIGYGIETMTGLPAFSYGAGLNLYDYELAAYYISRLGAYKIDRRKRNGIYLNTLKEFSVISFLKDLNTVFFPGGTRSRSGALEDSLKYGLLGTLIEAQNYNYKNGLNKKVMIVPLVVSYHFIFEAEELVNQHLRKEGRANYISSKSKKKASFFHLLQRFLKSDTEVYMSFGEPIDVFGNILDDQGNSLKNGEIIDIEQHFISEEKLTLDKQRNDVYTRVLAQQIVESYKTENVVLSSHVVAFSAYYLVEKKYSDLDKFTLLGLSSDQVELEKDNYHSLVRELIEELKVMSVNGELKLAPILHEDIEKVIDDGIKHLSSFHVNKPWYKTESKYKTMNLKLLYFYHNRLLGYDLKKRLQEKTELISA